MVLGAMESLASEEMRRGRAPERKPWPPESDEANGGFIVLRIETFFYVLPPWKI